MTHKQDLREAIAKMLPDHVDDDLTSTPQDIIFLANVFKDGVTMGFWSHSPWGRVHNTEEGWAVLDKNGDVVEEYVTKSHLQSNETDETFAEWRSRIRDTFGKSKRLCDEFTLENFWRLADV